MRGVHEIYPVVLKVQYITLNLQYRVNLGAGAGLGLELAQLQELGPHRPVLG